MTNAEYWRQRDVQNAVRIYGYADRQGQLVTRWFNRAAQEMDAAVRAHIGRYAEQNGLSLSRANQELVDAAALRRLAIDYEGLLARYPNDPVSKKMLDRLHTVRSMSRMQHLKAQLNLIVSDVFGRYENATTQTLTKLFEESYYKSLFDQQQFVGFGHSFSRLSTHFIAAAVNTAWSGKNYSERIWGDHRTSLARYMNRIVSIGVIEGKSNELMSAELQKAMSTSAYNARRLIRTDGSAVANRGSLLGYQEFGTKKYEFLATLDFKTSEICREMDGKVFFVEDAQQGVNLAPLHPFCRSTSIPHVPDEAFDEGDTRAARDGRGNTYRVPANMTFRAWYAERVENNAGEQLLARKYKNGRADAAQWARYRETLDRQAPGSLDDFQNIKYTDANRYTDLKWQYRHENYYNTHLTYDEQAAVSGYVSGGSYALNATLRDGVTLDADMQAMVEQLDAALEKLPVYDGEVIRSMVLEPNERALFMQSLLEKDAVTFPAYTSASTNPGYHDQPDVLIYIQSHAGRDARMANREESEIVFRRGTRFHIHAVRMQDGILVIKMEEIV